MTKRPSSKAKKRTPFYRRKSFLIPVGIVLGVLLVAVIAFQVSPYPGAAVIRSVFDADAQKKRVALEAYKASAPISVISNQLYIEGNRDAALDVYIPDQKVANGEKLPVVIWTHGGAWISGDKTNAAPYFKLLAEKGVVVVSLNYTLAPMKTYPTQINQLNAAHAYIQANADRFHLDPHKIILAGDSAGAQLSSQMAAIITNPDYAKEVEVSPTLRASDLAAVILYCGIYKMEELVHPLEYASDLLTWGTDVTVWSYTGTQDEKSPLIRQMSAFYHVDKNFPKTFISGGNGDPLTDVQSKPFANELKSLGVDVTTLFYDEDHQPSLPHEYQFVLDNEDGIKALVATQDFLQKL